MRYPFAANRLVRTLAVGSVLLGRLCALAQVPQITSLSTNQTVAEGGLVVLVGSANGTAPLRYQWLLNGGALIGETNRLLVLPHIALSNSGTYTFRATNGLGSAEATADLTVITTLTNGLVAHYPLDANALDITTNANHGTLINTTKPAPDRYGFADKGLSFNGAGDYVSIPNSGTWNLPGDLTVSFWYQADPGKAGVVLYHGDGGSLANDQLQISIGIGVIGGFPVFPPVREALVGRRLLRQPFTMSLARLFFKPMPGIN